MRGDEAADAWLTGTFSVLVALCGIVFLSTWLDRKSALARKLTPVLTILTVSTIASNLGIIPTDTESFPLYGTISDYAVQFAVCLVLFQMNLSTLKHAGLTMLVAFMLACIATSVGTVVAALVFDSRLTGFVPEPWRLAAPFCATYIGGSINFNAMWQELKVGDSAAYAAGNAVDNLTSLPFLLLMIVLPDRLRRFFPVARVWEVPAAASRGSPAAAEPARLRLFDLSALMFMVLAVMLGSQWIAKNLLPGFPYYLVITALALTLAQWRATGRLEGAAELGNYAFYLFFAVIGATCDVEKAVKLAPTLFLYVSTVIGVHVALLFGVGRLFRLDARILACASLATKSGPPMVIAFTTIKGWHELALPGVAVGLLGYGVGNFFGYGVAQLARALLHAG